MHSSTRRSHPSIAIIGSGFAGLAAAIELKSRGHENIVIFERGSEVGGVWRENTYPGAACDVPSPFYSFSYEPNSAWPRRYAPQPAILDYLRATAQKYGLEQHLRFNAEVIEMVFDEATSKWTLCTREDQVAVVDVVICAVGQLSRPALPTIPGRDSFTGPAFHSAQWNHSVDLTGRRVAVIGTGASAIQFVPAIQPQVHHLALFQRSAPYLLPRFDTAYSQVRGTLLRLFPFLQKAPRAVCWAGTETVAVAILYSRHLSAVFTKLSHWHMQRQLGDIDLMKKAWPNYPIGCKRILFSNSYFPALTEPNVELVAAPIKEIAPTGVRTSDGILHEIDVIIYGTGFTAQDFLAPMNIRGPGGIDLRTSWRKGARAYLGIAVRGFPNLFLMYGPNTNLGSGSIVYMLERQAGYIGQAVDNIGLGEALVVRDEVEERYDQKTQALLKRGIWSQCSNWYTSTGGRTTTNWPHTQIEYSRYTSRFDPHDYRRLKSRVSAASDP
jgi:cation diffusion facilitator CzcD-associated flavoprotein CzcO